MLTRDESARIVVGILGDMLERAPGSTNTARANGAQAYIEAECFEMDMTPDDLQTHHYAWLKAVLGDEETLKRIDELAAHAREVGEAALVAAGMDQIPWYD